MQIHRNKKKLAVGPEMEREDLESAGVLSWDDGNVLKLDTGGTLQHCEYAQMY